MTPEAPENQAFVDVIRTLNSALEAERRETAGQRELFAKERAEARRQRAELQREISRLVTMVEGLTGQLDALLKDRDETRRAELAKLREQARAAATQAMVSADGGADSGKGSSDIPKATPTLSTPNRDAHGRKPKPAHLERDTETYRPDRCSHCGGSNLTVRDTLVSESYDYVRAHVRVRQDLRTVCTCTDCLMRTVPEAPPMPMDRASCTFAMMAWLCVAKCGLFLPLDRVRRDFASQGAPIASSTLTRWWTHGADLLAPIAGAVRMSLLSDTHIRTDGTGLRVVLARRKKTPVKGEPRGGDEDDKGWLVTPDPYNGQLLVFGNDQHAVFWFTETKQGSHALDFLTVAHHPETREPIRWKGTITADAISAHDCLFADGDRIEAGCNAHGFRKFRDELDTAPLLASKAMGFIDGFYTVEAKAKLNTLTGAELLAYRQANAGPIAARFKTWLDQHIDDLLDTNPVRKAMRYYLNHWDPLTRFLSDPDVELDNNWSERALRNVALLRNNSLYASGREGAIRLCTLFTLIQTCRLLGVDAYEYLVWALRRIVPHSTNRGYTAADLTPAAYKAAEQKGA